MKVSTGCFLLFVIFYIIPSSLSAQDGKRAEGPIIEDFGAVFSIDKPDFETDLNREYKVIFDIAESPEAKDAINPRINTLARFLNMHAQAGVTPENLKVACVFHGTATKDAMNNAAYQKRYGTDNPNAKLIEELRKAGADIYLCGQSIHARGFGRQEIAKPIQLALSAMTVLITYQSKGYTLIKF